MQVLAIWFSLIYHRRPQYIFLSIEKPFFKNSFILVGCIVFNAAKPLEGHAAPSFHIRYLPIIVNCYRLTAKIITFISADQVHTYQNSWMNWITRQRAELAWLLYGGFLPDRLSMLRWQKVLIWSIQLYIH